MHPTKMPLLVAVSTSTSGSTSPTLLLSVAGRVSAVSALVFWSRSVTRTQMLTFVP